jgi:2'-5' RNA ligase
MPNQRPPRESALTIVIPEAEPAVADWRARYDPVSVAANIPAHVTLLYPFVPRDALTPEIEADLAALFASERPFTATFAGVCAFPAEVLYLAPDDPAPFDRLTRLLAARFPATPPYGGTIADPIPHITIGKTSALEHVEAVGREAGLHWAAGRLPVTVWVTRAAFMEQDEVGKWSVRRWLEFGS